MEEEDLEQEQEYDYDYDDDHLSCGCCSCCGCTCPEYCPDCGEEISYWEFYNEEEHPCSKKWREEDEAKARTFLGDEDYDDVMDAARKFNPPLE